MTRKAEERSRTLTDDHLEDLTVTSVRTERKVGGKNGSRVLFHPDSKEQELILYKDCKWGRSYCLWSIFFTSLSVRLPLPLRPPLCLPRLFHVELHSVSRPKAACRLLVEPERFLRAFRN